MNLFAIIIGSIVGLAVGYFAGWLFVEYRWIPQGNMIWKGIVGALTGGFAGGAAGSISGDLNRASGNTSNKLLFAVIFGAFFGALGGTQFRLLGEVLDSISVSHPF